MCALSARHLSTHGTGTERLPPSSLLVSLSHVTHSICPSASVNDGSTALTTGDPLAIIQANAGGPYGSAALRGVQVGCTPLHSASTFVSTSLAAHAFACVQTSRVPLVCGIMSKHEHTNLPLVAQAASDKVWDTVKAGGDVGKSWFKARISINAHESEPWSATPIGPDGVGGPQFAFGLQ